MGQSSLRQQIQERAYQLWEAEGRPEGRSTEHWREAEQQLAGDASSEGQDGMRDLPVDTPPVETAIRRRGQASGSTR